MGFRKIPHTVSRRSAVLKPIISDLQSTVDHINAHESTWATQTS